VRRAEGFKNNTGDPMPIPFPKRFPSGGFSLLELTTAVGIVAVTSLVVAPGLSSTVEMRGADGDIDFLTTKLRNLRLEALRTQGAARFAVAPIDGRPGVYRIGGWSDDEPVDRDSCLTHAFPTVLFSEEWNPKSPYYIRSIAPNGICFFDDGSATGASILMTDSPPVVEGEAAVTPDSEARETGLRARIDVPLATGLPDVVKDYGNSSPSGDTP
jgi:type II secretory pathway pseudopilin PulG